MIICTRSQAADILPQTHSSSNTPLDRAASNAILDGRPVEEKNSAEDEDAAMVHQSGGSQSRQPSISDVVEPPPVDILVQILVAVDIARPESFLNQWEQAWSSYGEVSEGNFADPLSDLVSIAEGIAARSTISSTQRQYFPRLRSLLVSIDDVQRHLAEVNTSLSEVSASLKIAGKKSKACNLALEAASSALNKETTFLNASNPAKVRTHKNQLKKLTDEEAAAAAAAEMAQSTYNDLQARHMALCAKQVKEMKQESTLRAKIADLRCYSAKPATNEIILPEIQNGSLIGFTRPVTAMSLTRDDPTIPSHARFKPFKDSAQRFVEEREPRRWMKQDGCPPHHPQWELGDPLLQCNGCSAANAACVFYGWRRSCVRCTSIRKSCDGYDLGIGCPLASMCYGQFTRQDANKRKATGGPRAGSPSHARKTVSEANPKARPLRGNMTETRRSPQTVQDARPAPPTYTSPFQMPYSYPPPPLLSFPPIDPSSSFATLLEARGASLDADAQEGVAHARGVAAQAQSLRLQAKALEAQSQALEAQSEALEAQSKAAYGRAGIVRLESAIAIDEAARIRQGSRDGVDITQYLRMLPPSLRPSP